MKRLLSLLMAEILLLSTVGQPALAAGEGEESESITRQTPGIYFSHPETPQHTTSANPQLALDPAALREFMRTHPELADHRVVLVVPSLFGDKNTIEQVKAALTELGIPPQVEVIRRPQKWWEKILDFFPRRQDWQKPLPEEIKTGHVMVFGGEILSISLFTYLAMTNQITGGVAAAAVGLDLSQQAALTYPVRSLSAYFNRQSPARQVLANFLIGALFSTNFFLLFNHADLEKALPTFLPTVLGGAVETAFWSNTSVAAFKWEFNSENKLPLEKRRIYRSRILLALQVLLSPFYIYSVSPFAETLIQTPLMGLNLGHLVIVGAGTAAAASWPLMDRISRWTSRLFCRAALSPGQVSKKGKKEDAP